MINLYYLLPMEDAHIVNYSQVVEEEALEFNNTGLFICKTFEGVINDMVMSAYTPINKEDLKQWMRDNTESI
jgi:hypothetical protein